MKLCPSSHHRILPRCNNHTVGGVWPLCSNETPPLACLVHAPPCGPSSIRFTTDSLSSAVPLQSVTLHCDAPYVKKKKSLILAPAGQLHLVPPAALSDCWREENYRPTAIYPAQRAIPTPFPDKGLTMQRCSAQSACMLTTQPQKEQPQSPVLSTWGPRDSLLVTLQGWPW